MKLLKSFGYAFCGIWYCIKNERNMRIHICAAAAVILFSLFFELSPVKYAVLFILMGLVISLELVNTALESAANAITEEYNPKIKILKDVAAGAVLVMAMASVAVAVVMFWQAEGFINIFNFYSTYPWVLAPTGVGIILAVIFIAIGPNGFYKLFKKKR